MTEGEYQASLVDPPDPAGEPVDLGRLLALDLETDGVDTGKSRIVEIALCNERGDPELHSLVNPGRPIPAEAVTIHGITDEMVAEAPPFRDLAAEVQVLLMGRTLLGYCHRTFDTLILDAELRRAGQPGIDLQKVVEVDLYRVWQEMEPRTLAGALTRFLRMFQGDRHRALEDARVLPALMEAMSQTFGVGLEEMVKASRPADEVDRSSKFVRAPDGTILFNFSKHAGAPALSEPGMLRWMLERDFPADSKAVCRQLLSLSDRST